MKKYIWLFIIVISIIMLSSCSSLSNTTKDTLKGEVINVVDGDTVDVRFADGTEERIRLLLIDTPETKHPAKPVQPFGPEASSYTKEQLLNKQIRLELDAQERDRYGRLLAYVYVDNEMFNEQLLAKGLARVVVYPPNTKYVDSFREIQKQAQKKGLGIWSIEDYQKEEETSNNSTSPKKDDCLIKGNINSKGEKIYHTPDSPSYKLTKPEEWFCTKKDAEEAGFRAPKFN